MLLLSETKPKHILLKITLKTKFYFILYKSALIYLIISSYIYLSDLCGRRHDVKFRVGQLQDSTQPVGNVDIDAPLRFFP